MSKDRIDRMRKLSKELGWEFLGDKPTHPIFQEGYIIRSAEPAAKPPKRSAEEEPLDSAPPEELSKDFPEEE